MKLGLLLSLIAVLASGCRRHRAPTEMEVPAPPAPTARVPVDRLLPDELAEGPEKAFGLPVPRLMALRNGDRDVLYYEGEVPAERVANFVRQRVSADKVETGPAKTVFPRATVRGQPGVELFIVIFPRNGNTQLEVRNVTPGKEPPGLSEEERWRAAGFKPDGKLADPNHLQ